MMDISKIKWIMNRGTRVLWISMDWKTPSDDSPESTTAPNCRCTVSSCARSSPAPLPTWPKKGNDSDSRLKKAVEHLQEIRGFSKNTQKDTHTQMIYIYIIFYIYWYIWYYIYYIYYIYILYTLYTLYTLYILYILYIIYYIDIVCSFLSGIDRGLLWDLLCNPSSSMPVCLDCPYCPASSASSRARSWETLLVQGPIQWLFSDSATPLVSESVQLKLFHFLILFQLIQPWWGSPVHRRCQKKMLSGPASRQLARKSVACQKQSRRFSSNFTR